MDVVCLHNLCNWNRSKWWFLMLSEVSHSYLSLRITTLRAWLTSMLDLPTAPSLFPSLLRQTAGAYGCPLWQTAGCEWHPAGNSGWACKEPQHLQHSARGSEWMRGRFSVTADDTLPLQITLSQELVLFPLSADHVMWLVRAKQNKIPSS